MPWAWAGDTDRPAHRGVGDGQRGLGTLHRAHPESPRRIGKMTLFTFRDQRGNPADCFIRQLCLDATCRHCFLPPFFCDLFLLSERKFSLANWMQGGNLVEDFAA